MPPTPPRVLITAGPTHEPIDAVRYLANRSSGRMGVALAEASTSRGWPTTLLLGPTPTSPPQTSHLHTIRFQTAADLQHLLREHWPLHDVLLMAAAVADYKPRTKSAVRDQLPEEKIKRSDTPLVLELEPTPDLLAEAAAASRPDQVLIGFALEPANRLRESATHKLSAKGVHAIVANPLQTMDSPFVTASLLLRDGRVLEAGSQRTKQDFAIWLLDQLSQISSSTAD